MRSVADFARGGGVRTQSVLLVVLWTLLASAIVYESDAYRYVTIALVILAFTRHKLQIKQASQDWLAWLCYLWSAYVLLRFLTGIIVFGEKGTSEWLYAFPAFFPVIGAVLYATRRFLFPAATFLIICGLIGLVATLDLPAIFRGDRVAPLFHNNPIHAAVGSSMLFISSLFWLLYVSETARLATQTRVALSVIGFVTGIASLLGVLGAQSKGAWLALAATTVFMALLGLSYSRGMRRIQPIAILLILIAILAAIALPFVERVAGSTMTASNALTTASIATGDVIGAVANTIEDPLTPQAMRERLMLWMNAWELVQTSPVIGWGNLWLREWPQTRYANVGYTLLHNGYLELLVRHGLVGLAFLLVFTIAAARRLNLARLSGVLSPSLAGYLYSIAFFFLCTIASNSNNRLALGESFFILAGSSIFALTLLRRNTQGKDAPGHNDD